MSDQGGTDVAKPAEDVTVPKIESSSLSSTTEVSKKDDAEAKEDTNDATATTNGKEPVEPPGNDEVSVGATLADPEPSSSKNENDPASSNGAPIVGKEAEEKTAEEAADRRPRRSRAAAFRALEAIHTASEPKPPPKKKEATTATTTTTVGPNEQQTEALEKLNLNRLVEHFQHIPATGQFYPHHGKMKIKLAQEGRIPPRWVVRWESPEGSTCSNDCQREDEWTQQDLDDHDASVLAGTNPFRSYNARRPEKNWNPPLKWSYDAIKDRYHQLVLRDMEHESFCQKEGDLLPTLVLVAALEDALQTSLQYQQAQQRQANERDSSLQAKQRKSNNNNHQNAHPPLYYTTNPHSYLVQPTREADAQEQLASAFSNPKSVLTPSVLAQRIRDGCAWAWAYSQQQHEENSNETTTNNVLDGPSHTATMATLLELEDKNAKEALLNPTTAIPKEDAEAPSSDPTTTTSNGEPRRSFRSGLGERTALFDPEPLGRRSTRGGSAMTYSESSQGVPEPNPVQKGGRVALWWLQMLAKEDSREEDEDEGSHASKDDDVEMDNTKESPLPKKETPATTTTKPADKSEAAAKSNMITGDSYEDAMGGVVDDDDDDDQTGRTDDDEDFEMSKADEEDEELEDVTKERSLTPVSHSDAEDDDEPEDEVDEEHAIVWDNPYLTPSVPAILEYLSKPKSISGEDVQRAMDDILLRTKHNKRSTHYGLDVQSLQTFDRAVLHWENPNHPTEGSLVLKCVSGESIPELQKLDAQTFGRCKFELEIIGSKESTIQIRNREDFEQRSEEYKRRRHGDRWRFKGIHEGYAVWPSWKEAADAWLQQNVQPQQLQEQKDTTDTNNDDDEALARKLAAEAATAEEEAAEGRGRRSRRGTTSGKSEGVFYGNQSNMTQKQLMDALLRLVKAQGCATMVHLQGLVMDDSSDPLRRIRIALGKIVWKRNLLTRKPSTTDESDKALLQELVSGKSLVQYTGDLAKAAENSESSKNTTPVVEIPDDAKDLVEYLKALHTTELKLRNLVLKQLGTIPLPVLATSADERVGTMESMDAADFEDPTTIEWKTSGSEFIGKLIYRPNASSVLGVEGTPCYWYTIKDVSEEIPSDADDAEPGSMERRKRFRAVPHNHSSSDILLLTEAQVRAGMLAGEVQNRRDTSSTLRQTSLASNPFASEIGERITMVAVDGDGEISGRVVGHDSIVDPADETDVEYRILVLPDPTEHGESGNAFWATLDIRADDASYMCQPEGESAWYSIENQDFHVDSEPYKACQSILEWLTRQSKAMPFLEPVDPVALGIPSYPDIVKHPMDISTMMQKLENGAYSNIPPGQSVGQSLVCRMLNGPFRTDLELVFDNAMLFNPPDDWIHLAAASLKKTALRKIQTASHAAEKNSNGGASNQRKSLYADEDSDVDMYEYESDHDEDFASGKRGKRKRPRGGVSGNKDEAAARPMEHPIKLQNFLKDGNDLKGRFANYPINGVAGTYSMPPGWSCRTATFGAAPAEESDVDEEDEEANQEYLQEMAELLALQQRFGDAESTSLRRSTRETRPTTGRRSKTKNASNKIEGLEYYLDTTSSNITATGTTDEDTNTKATLSSIPSSRLDVEILQEKRHEDYFAKLYQKYESRLSSSSDYALYSSGSFPPYLGRVVPAKNHHSMTWEIRPPFVVSALRWVLRGLVQSGHLTATEPMSTGGAGASNNDTSAGSVITNDVYYWDPESRPFGILDTRELQRKKRAGKSDDDSSEDEVEMSEYEKLRAERVARNAERLKALGLA